MSEPSGRLTFGSEEANKIAKQDKERERILAESGPRIEALKEEIMAQRGYVDDMMWELESGENHLADLERELRTLTKLRENK